jgi:FtsZ-binding cell division protein ZapB
LLRYLNRLDTSKMNNEINTKSKKKDRRNNIIVIALSVILGIVVVLYFLQNREHRTIVNEINAEKDSIQFELTQIATSYDSLKTENDTINEQLFVAQAKVKDLLLEVEQTKKVSYSKISDYQKQVTTLRGIMRDFVVQIDSLNRRNEELMAENLEVKQQYKQVEQKNQQLNQEKEQLQNNLKRASMLKTRDLVAEPINSRSKVTKFARRAEKIRIYFVLGQNVATERGAKNIYARIMRPDQLLMSKSEDNLFQFEDLKIQYSAMREVVYEGKDLPVAIFWDNTGEPELMTGSYTVNLFADGFEIGETTFTLQ